MSIDNDLRSEITESLKSAVIDLINEHAARLAGAGLDAKQAGDMIGAYLITAAWMAAAHGKRQAPDEAPIRHASARSRRSWPRAAVSVDDGSPRRHVLGARGAP